MNRSKQIAKKGIKLNAFINIEYCYIWLSIQYLAKVLASDKASFSPLAHPIRIQNAQSKSISLSVEGKAGKSR